MIQITKPINTQEDSPEEVNTETFLNVDIGNKMNVLTTLKNVTFSLTELNPLINPAATMTCHYLLMDNTSSSNQQFQKADVILCYNGDNKTPLQCLSSTFGSDQLKDALGSDFDFYDSGNEYIPL